MTRNFIVFVSSLFLLTGPAFSMEEGGGNPKNATIEYSENDINYLHPTNQNTSSILQGVSENFERHETMGEALKLQPGDLKPLFASMATECHKFSFLAVDSKTGKLVGALIADDYNFIKKLSPPENLSARAAPIISLLRNLEESFEKQFISTVPETFMYHYALYVDPKYSRKGIATNLVRLSEEQARKKGFNYIVTIATGVASQGLFQKRHFGRIDRINYADFTFSDQHVFASLQGKTCDILIKDVNTNTPAKL